MNTTTYSVTGMTCAHCVQAVTAELAALPGVQHVRVDLVESGTSQVHVDSEAPLDTGAVAAAVDEAGYTVVAS
ncbi:heavy metal-associated domain protein [Aeromicrobium marinum DSM 15272]|uniref:Heavy metal-associated domain protein n=1 Tax=Aeromicrobium marinum DSM 15272 TaxID=585531 RepID=E2S8J2_9ACTN|nr:heavy-metal-associated domain-containing protein [Aeromicrobium marinum]EFQ84497.1 heavy metal-associated domain protein [Aeromicrobium marinum DSM 15272]